MQSRAELKLAKHSSAPFDESIGEDLPLSTDQAAWALLWIDAWADRSMGVPALQLEAVNGQGSVIKRWNEQVPVAPFASLETRSKCAIPLPPGTRRLRGQVRGKGPSVGAWNWGVYREAPGPLSLQTKKWAIQDGDLKAVLEPASRSITLERQGRPAGRISLPNGWFIAGNLATSREAQQDEGRFVASTWLLQSDQGLRGLLELRADETGAEEPPNQGLLGFRCFLQDAPARPWTLGFDAPAGGEWLLPFNQGLKVRAKEAQGLDPGFALDPAAGHFMSFPGWVWQDSQGGIVFQLRKADLTLRPQVHEERVDIRLMPQMGGWQGERGFWVGAYRGGPAAAGQALRDMNGGGIKGFREPLIPGPERLAGAVNIHYWKKAAWWNNEPRPEALAKEMHASGLDRVLWSQKVAAEAVVPMAKLGWLLGSYENFQDLYPIETPLSWVNKDGWPEQAVHDRWGRWVRGWPHKEGGKTYHAGVRSSVAAAGYVKKELAARKAHGQHAVFLDTTTASGSVEDWTDVHPMDRATDIDRKRRQLWEGGSLGLIVGSESGSAWAVNSAHYFEGMQSPWVGRFADSGYELGNIRPATEAMLKWNLSPRHRVPLFELAYHDAAVNYEYWGDAANRLPEHWRRKDLFSVLYAQPQLWVMDEERWASQQKQALKSYRTWSPVVRHLFGQRMTDWKVLDKDGDVQETHWEDGSVVRVDFARDQITLEGPLKSGLFKK